MKPSVIRKLFVTALLLPTCAWAGHVESGLWESTVQMHFIKGGPKIPPEQLAKMKQMGIQVPFGGQPMQVKHCITPEQAARDEPPQTTSPDSGCSARNGKMSGNTYTADMVCNGRMKGSGKLEVHFDSKKHYHGSFHFRGTKPNGGEMEMTNSFDNRWLGSDCGTTR